ncbi:sensor histidine kinase [Wenyingzhuangia sp. IMCC45574]
MELFNIITLVFIILGAVILLMSATSTSKIFHLLKNDQLKTNWKKLRLLMLVFFFGYLAIGTAVILEKNDLLILLSGTIFLMGALFVFIVVRTGLDSFIKLNEMNQNLGDTQVKNLELEKFAYITSHDLKAPLRGISSLATFIKEDLEDGLTEDVKSHVDLMQGRIEHLENLITGILHYSRIGKILIESIDLNLMVKQELENYVTLKNVVFNIDENLPVINGDKIQLSQVVSNLISNAIKHNDKEVCMINISCLEDSEHYIITFKDNGPGIEMQYHEKIFDVFQTLDSKDTPDNTGIGLSIVKKIIEKHNAKIWVESNGKLGSKFIISYSKAF